MLNLLAIVQQATAELGLSPPSSVASNSVDAGVAQMLALLNREGNELAAMEGGWPALRGEHLITLVVGQEAYPFAADLAYYVGGAIWDRTTHWQAVGPLSPGEWQAIRSGIWPGGVQPRYRIMGGMIHFDPVPAQADTIALEYVSRYWCQSQGGNGQPGFQADTDVPLLPDDLFVQGLKWRFLAAKGMNYAEERASYEMAVARTRARAEAPSPLSLSGGPRIFRGLSIPETNWPGR